MDIEGLVFIGASVDGYIAREDGDMDWLISRGQAVGDTGYDDFFASVDAVAMGRTTYEKVLALDIWPYQDTPVHVVSSTLGGRAAEQVQVHRTIDDLCAALKDEDIKRVYIDGGRLVQGFLRRGLVSELTITHVPVLLGGGIPLFGRLDADLPLEHIRTRVLGGGAVQTTYRVA
jgi:dihydrofolate reductase